MPCPPAGDLLDPGIELGSPALQAESLPAEAPNIYAYFLERRIHGRKEQEEHRFDGEASLSED